MFVIILAWAARDLIEVFVTGVLVTLLMVAFGAVPFLVEYYIDDRREPPQE
jgi:hypothetical protein